MFRKAMIFPHGNMQIYLHNAQMVPSVNTVVSDFACLASGDSRQVNTMYGNKQQ